MKRLLPLALLLLASGCTFAPDIGDVHPSQPPTPAAAGSADAIVPATGQPQQFALGVAAPSDWWHEFASADLDALVVAALTANEDIRVADAALRQARASAAAAGAARLPQVDASFQAQRAQTSASLAPPVTDANQLLYSLSTAQLTVTYPIDLFGAVRSHVASAHAAAEVQRCRLLAARQTVVANLVNAVIQRASLADQIAAARHAIAVNRDILELLQRRQAIGAVGAADVATQQTALAAAEGTLPPLVRAEAHQRAVIAVLLGRAPGIPLPRLPGLSDLTLPATLPLALPADLVRRRPDILAAGAQLRGAAADVGTAIAARLPQLQLTANLGGTAQNFAQMFAQGNPFWAVIGGVTQPIFHAGALRHQQHAAEAALDGAKAQYRAAALQAFVDVSDALTGLHSDADALDAATRAETAADRALGFVRRQLALGDVGTLTLLNATAADAQAHAQAVQARAARLTDSVALFQAVGGGIE
ncbi:efflux transporter outer membrane subunit [Sphingomonas sp. RT2P30]|uniref:efflux transporter outer membrane subunit n=1 Tax=Parasphingomonas halimpatiens TaxID=3096162 RepID=UPI002FC94162